MCHKSFWCPMQWRWSKPYEHHQGWFGRWFDCQLVVIKTSWVRIVLRGPWQPRCFQWESKNPEPWTFSIQAVDVLWILAPTWSRLGSMQKHREVSHGQSTVASCGALMKHRPLAWLRWQRLFKSTDLFVRSIPATRPAGIAKHLYIWVSFIVTSDPQGC